MHDNPILSSPASARQLPQCSGSEPNSIAAAKARLQPADPDDILSQLGPVLALCGAAGMSPDDRTEWLAAAIDALKDVPADLLEEALAECRKRADHPSKVIPFVTSYTEERIMWRRNNLERARDNAAPAATALPSPGKSYCTSQEAAEIIDKHVPWVRQGLEAPAKVHRGPPRMPTRADYIALGVDPAYFEEKAA